ncbi:helix-turn-helix transcriptional regulator [Dyadobacter sandarakinus]|uniref:Helix-turn-helix domain-containing protein n=1 Tax=Dyadobacter sandarakinus TaxID=2747268 RepID=A0ABX7I272_9BACT|nr:helix-turn-helix transcriptional regulator [Dyadobacter sandarakinus]QRQ99923.1 helix-turn-helix domain-containing protein [Dyadobacter sandarakinus]
MSIVSNNIKYLRRLNGLTQEQFARKIAIKRSLLGAYEEARANPNLTNLKNMAAAFGITVDNLLKNDLRKLRETPDLSLPLNGARPMTVSHSGTTSPGNARLQVFSDPQPLSKILEQYPAPEAEIRTVSRQVNLKPVSGEPVPPAASRSKEAVAAPVIQPAAPQPQFPVFNNQYTTAGITAPATDTFATIQWVARSRESEYLANFQNPAYLSQLPVFQLPNLSAGYYRAFEGGQDFPFAGSLLIGTFVRNWYEIQDGMQYVFVLRNAGVVYRKAFNQVKTTGNLLLLSDLRDIGEMQVPLQDVYEVWEIRAFVSAQLPPPQPSLDKIAALADELQKELDQYRAG